MMITIKHVEIKLNLGERNHLLSLQIPGKKNLIPSLSWNRK